MAKSRTSRALEIQRLDKLQSMAWPKAMQGDPAAIDRCLNAIALRSRLLGLTRQQPPRKLRKRKH